MAAWLWSVPPPHYPVYVRTGTFALRQRGRQALQEIKPGDVIFAYLSRQQVIAGMFEAVGTAFHDATPLVSGGAYPHRVRVRPVLSLSEEAWVPYAAFAEKLDVTKDYGDFRTVVQQVLHPLPEVDAKVLEFLVRARQASDLDLDKVFAAYDAYRRARTVEPAAEAPSALAEPPMPYAAFDRASAVAALLRFIEGQGFVYEPWAVAAYVTALRTKPFVILAGVTGVGKTRLPLLVAEGTGGRAHLIPVRPDWADSAEVLGYTDLQGTFRPGAVLRAARAAQEDPARPHTAVLDEMNLARVEHYFAEVLSRIEDRHPALEGGFASSALLGHTPPASETWASVTLPPNLALVGTVNMDESAHGFSRKVLDRAFTLELAAGDLTAHPAHTEHTSPQAWPVAAWHPRALRLAGLENLSAKETALIAEALAALAEANAVLAPAQLQIGYRTRDEVALFVLHAAELSDAFRTRDGDSVLPLDLALHMKLLPRLAGGSLPLRRALLGLLGWATTGTPLLHDHDADAVLATWHDAARPDALPQARFPRTAARLCLMWERLLADGFTAYWL